MLSRGARWLWWSANILELVRDTLIFVPVIYTWWQLADALKAWSSYSGTDSFLLAWQQGFPMHGKQTVDPLSDSAMVVAGVVIGVIGVTWFASLFRGLHDANLERRQRDLAALLAEANLTINQSLLTAAPDVSKQELAQVSIRISDSATKLSEALGTASASITGAVDANPGSKLHDMFKQWTEMARRWAKSADELRALGTRLNSTQEVAAQLTSAQQALTQMLADIQAESGKLVQGLEGETTRLLQALEQERVMSRQAVHANLELAEQAKQSTAELAKSILGLSDRAQQFNEMVHRLERLINRLDGGGNPDGDYS